MSQIPVFHVLKHQAGAITIKAVPTQLYNIGMPVPEKKFKKFINMD